MKKHTYKDALEKMVVISTGHITRKDADILKEGSPFLMLRVIPHEYGWFVTGYADPHEDWPDYSDHLRELGLSESFIMILFDLRVSNVLWVNFDCDGYEIENLPTYEW